jgi:hypothetical protein
MCVSVLCVSTCLKAGTAEAGIGTVKHVQFICPYEQYKRVKPFIQSQEQEQEAASVSTETVGVNGTRQDSDGDDEQKQEVSPEQQHFIK